MKVASLWSDVVDDTPVLDPRIEAAEEDAGREAILAFLGGGTVVLRAAGYTEDWLTPGHPSVVPIGFRTDGTWIWPDEIAYYVSVHHLLPPPDLLDHMKACHFQAEVPSEQAVRDAQVLLLGEQHP